MRTLVVLPTYNEAENIGEVLQRVRRALPAADVLVVDDSSPDGTAALAREMGADLGSIDVMIRPAKSGLGQAYRDGFRRGRADGYEILIEMDSDLSHDPAALPSLVEGIKSGADLVIGSRYIPGGSIPDWSWHREALSRNGNRYAAAMLRMGVHDATSGFRAYRGEILDDIALETVRADGYGFQIEMAYRVLQAGGEIREVPIAFVDRLRGTSKMSSRIVFEALGLVSWWGIRDRVLRRGPARRTAGARRGR